ncbi:MAG: AmmeMemoRadiSam system protein B [Ardenticatenaceae bacterium]|nr:AmmeMemoRadiSam system protein B [Ardenticatenaceae bacterium]
MDHPKLRPLEIQPIEFRDQQMWLLHDPQKIAEEQLILPPILAQMALYCDGQHDVPSIYRQLALDAGFELPAGTIEQALAQLDQAYMLDNDNFYARREALREAFLQQPFRPMTIAGVGYPDTPEALKTQFEAYAAHDDEQDVQAWAQWRGRGVISPHIDYQRGGQVYARVWRRVAPTLADVDLVLMFATDHNGGLGSLTLTKKPYETPHGLLPTDEALVDKLAQAIGEDAAYQFELNHRQEHSVELSAVWLHHVAGENPPPMVPLLVGSFHHFILGQGHPDQDERINRLIETLRQETAGKKVLCVASVDLSHVGPAFGDSYTMDNGRRESLWTTDHSLIEALSQGDGRRWYDEIAAVQDQNKVCGFSPVYLMMRYLGENVKGTAVAYDQCPADGENHSLVSIFGMLLE